MSLQNLYLRMQLKGHSYLNTEFCRKYKLDAETKVTKRFRNPRARGCSVPSEARALLRARGFLIA